MLDHRDSLLSQRCTHLLLEPASSNSLRLDSARLCWLVETIARNPEARRSSSLRRLHDRAFVADLRYRLKPEWQCIEMAPRASALSGISGHSSSRYSARLKSTPCCTPYKPAAAHQPSLPTASMCKTSGAVVIPQPSGNARNTAIRTVKPGPKAGQQFWAARRFPERCRVFEMHVRTRNRGLSRIALTYALTD